MKLSPPGPPIAPSKFCKNCHWFKSNWWADTKKCFNPMNITLDPVTGGVKYLLPPSRIRELNYLCGPDGKWYEPKLTSSRSMPS